jgi:polyisoprenoid-binding protein YceI
MKFLSSIVIFLFAFSALIAQDKVMVNADQSKLEWKAYKVTGSHNGEIDLKDGYLLMENGMLVGGQFTIDMTTIDVQDLEGEYKQKLENHLRSDDFFSVDKHNTATIELTNVVPRGNGSEYKINGNLTIKGKTAPVKFIAKMEGDKAMADIEVDRSEYDVKYGSGTFFDNLGDKTIYDIFDMNVTLAWN